MNHDDSRKSDDAHQVLQFRPRTGKARTRRPDKVLPRKDEARSPVRDFARYQQSPGRDDYSHRMKMNAVVVALTSVLVTAGVWIVTMIAHPHS